LGNDTTQQTQRTFARANLLCYRLVADSSSPVHIGDSRTVVDSDGQGFTAQITGQSPTNCYGLATGKLV